MKSAGKLKSTGPGGGSGDSVFIPMPLLPTSTYHFLHRVIDIAYDELVAAGEGLALGGARQAPHFAHSSWRRFADSAAAVCLARGGCTTTDIDLHFGWRLKKMKKVMRLHYASRGTRAARARITELI